MYVPKRVLFEEKALSYELGAELYKSFKEKGVVTHILKGNRVSGIPGDSPQSLYSEGKSTLVVRVRKKGEFQTCKPSAHYQLPLVSGCAGKCEYCYLNTRFGNKPYITVYANIDEILEETKKYIEERKPQVTIFEGAATSDPIPLEEYTGMLAKTIEFIGKEEYAKFRFVTKFDTIDSLLGLNHNGKTTIRFSINTERVIKTYEHGTVDLYKRIEASKKIISNGYNLGFIIGPVILYEGWKKEYLFMLHELRKILKGYESEKIHFEVISHRFTTAAKNKIIEIFPKTTLPMVEEERKFKYGQFGYGKYLYKQEELNEMKEFFQNNISSLFPSSEVDYII
ncbi:spore photoproduct lyase SplB [Gottschalkia acidurici 9a]|uniref:Spore photoproduct lyase SplB n=1 Tax=Gottschalkia acidurici (strain ATCC 7906 / DSM 604 / BCRC 14475 / CIP 104303 / KCTC 5404 / NCIMB 10678 / 9a) TaxID=1128398 RepID=K0AYC5_GOTA9|nr:spore photoproduct lyase [Gottschalkia acidurici]AFS77760.1 spore photoproduct lyase SplB [Gottschalkia acidurici 9a]